MIQKKIIQEFENTVVRHEQIKLPIGPLLLSSISMVTGRDYVSLTSRYQIEGSPDPISSKKSSYLSNRLTHEEMNLSVSK